MKLRDANTDLVRAVAILAVVIHHISQFLPSVPESLRGVLALGGYGVDLFFVLSGWLIGGLYFAEQQRCGNVEVIRFWSRRWLRTLPPYLAVLPLAYLTVYLARHEPFDWRYLCFLQNYETKIPFYLISWSLCVEEHFYLCLPLVLLLLGFFRAPLLVSLPLIAIASLTARLMQPIPTADQPFGFAFTATHLRLEGLALGVWCAYLSVNRSDLWHWAQERARSQLVPAGIALATIPLWSPAAQYQFGGTVVAVVAVVFLTWAVSCKPLAAAKWRATKCVALWSYSIYLTHSIVLNAGIMGADRLGISREVMVPLWLAAMLLAGFLCFRLVEVPAINVRDRHVPRRVSPSA